MYDRGRYHTGNLVTLSDASDHPLRSISDVVLDVDDLVARLKQDESRIEEVRFVGDRRLTLSAGDGTVGADELDEVLAVDTEEIDVYEERDLATE